MRTRLSLLAVCAMALSTHMIFAEPAPVLGTERDIDGRLLPFGRATYLPSDTPLGTGPYQAIMVEETSFTNHVLYYPANMEATGKLPVIVWGNGACINAGNRFRIFLTEIASHGFIVIAGGAIANIKYEVGPQEQPGAPAPTALMPPDKYDDAAYNNAVGRNTAAQMIEGIDWAVKENEREGSRFYHKLDTTKIGVAGQSCGGGLAITVSADPRTSASIFFSAAGGGGGGRRGGGATTTNAAATSPAPAPANSQLDALHAPVLILTGDSSDIAYQGGINAAAYITKVPMFHGWQEKLTHIGTYGMPNGGQLGRLAWQWFAWQLRGDQVAAKVFTGTDCVLCVEAGWHIDKKKID